MKMVKRTYLECLSGTEGQNMNCNHPYNNDYDTGKEGDPDLRNSFYDEEVDELFTIDSPSQPLQSGGMHGEEAGDDNMYFHTEEDESDEWYQHGQCTMPETNMEIFKDEQPFRTVEKEPIVNTVNQILNLDNDIAKPGEFAYRGPLGHRGGDFKVQLMSYQNEMGAKSYDEEEVQVNGGPACEEIENNCFNNEDIEFDNDTEDESTEDYESEYSEDEKNDDDDNDNNDAVTACVETDTVSICEAMRKEVDECILSKNESPLITKNTSALFGCPFESSDSSDNEDGDLGVNAADENDSDDDEYGMDGEVSQGDAETVGDDDNVQEQGWGEQFGDEDEQQMESPVLQHSTSKMSQRSLNDLRHDSELRKPMLLNADEASTWNNDQQSRSLSPAPCAVTSYQYQQQGDRSDSVDVSPPLTDRGARFSFKPPASGDNNSEEKPSYVLSPKARKHIMEQRYGRKTPPPGARGRSRSPTVGRSKSDLKVPVKEKGGKSIMFMPIVTHEEREMAEAVSKEANKRSTKPRPQMAHLDELKLQTKYVKRKPSPMNRTQTPNNADAKRSNENVLMDAHQNDDYNVANTWVEPVKMAPKGFQDGKDLSNAIGKRVLVPKMHGYTMPKTTKDSGPDPDMIERREQLRQQRREQMAKLSSTAKERSNPPTYNPSSKLSNSEGSKSMEMKHGRPKEGNRKTGARVNYSSWGAEKSGKDYKKYGGDEAMSDDSPFSHLFDKKTKKPRKTAFANEKYKIKKIDQEVDPYDVKPISKKKQTNKSLEEEFKIQRNDPYMQMTENAKLIAAQRSSRWMPRSAAKKEGFKSDQSGGYEGKQEEKFKQLDGAGEGKEAEQKYRMMTFKIKSKQDMGQVVPVGNFESAGKRPGEKEEKPMQAVNMYKPDVEPKEVKHPTVEPSQPTEGPGFLSRLNPLSWFRQNPQCNLIEEDVQTEKKAKTSIKQHKSKYEVPDRSGKGEEPPQAPQTKAQGSSVDIATQPCGLATGEPDDSWKLKYEKLKEEKKEKLKMIRGNLKKSGHNKTSVSTSDNKDKYEHKMKRQSTLGNSSSNNAAKSQSQPKKRTFQTWKPSNN